mmetsp:Transcript_16333/g.38817  ORF Transcript_16333/g.38817 Transcript_16333/m.38817 type:complete len:238 (-) Transcript_16333:1482-2195(-)
MLCRSPYDCCTGCKRSRRSICGWNAACKPCLPMPCRKSGANTVQHRQHFDLLMSGGRLGRASGSHSHISVEPSASEINGSSLRRDVTRKAAHAMRATKKARRMPAIQSPSGHAHELPWYLTPRRLARPSGPASTSLTGSATPIRPWSKSKDTTNRCRNMPPKTHISGPSSWSLTSPDGSSGSSRMPPMGTTSCSRLTSSAMSARGFEQSSVRLFSLPLTTTIVVLHTVPSGRVWICS